MLKYAWTRRFRIPMIAAQGMSFNSSRVASVTWAAASPTISMSLTKDNTNWRSLSRSFRVRPEAKERGLLGRLKHVTESDRVNP